MNKEELAKWLHDNYEEVAKQKEWNTQGNCKVEFDTLPDANKQTMIEIAQRILDFKLLRLHFVSVPRGTFLREGKTMTNQKPAATTPKPKIKPAPQMPRKNAP